MPTSRTESFDPYKISTTKAVRRPCSATSARRSSQNKSKALRPRSATRTRSKSSASKPAPRSKTSRSQSQAAVQPRRSRSAPASRKKDQVPESNLPVDASVLLTRTVYTRGTSAAADRLFDNWCSTEVLFLSKMWNVNLMFTNQWSLFYKIQDVVSTNQFWMEYKQAPLIIPLQPMMLFYDYQKVIHHWKNICPIVVVIAMDHDYWSRNCVVTKKYSPSCVTFHYTTSGNIPLESL